MDIVSRAKNICLSPTTEWPVIAGEVTPPATLITGYVLPLAAIGAVAGFIGNSLIGVTLPFSGVTYRVPIGSGLVGVVMTLVMSVVACVVVGMIVNALAPTFGAQKDSNQALKVVVYSYTPAWLAGVLQILPMLGVLGILAALYGIYLLYLGLPRLMKCPEDKAVGYTAVVVLCAVVFMVVLAAITTAIVGVGAMGSGMMSGGPMGQSSAPASQVDPDSTLGRLQQLGEQMEQSAAKAEAAAASGDTAGQMNAAMEGLGALLGGGRRVEPLDLEQLKAFAPETFAGLARTEIRAERAGIATLMVSTVEATYGDGADRVVELEIVDSGGISGLTGLASWVGAQGEREDSSGSERTFRQDGRLTHERISKTGGENEFGLVLGERFMIMAKSRALDLAALKAAVATLDLSRLEAMKDAGVQR
jgi:hypothetical protein